jgi:hypothetical protein
VVEAVEAAAATTTGPAPFAVACAAACDANAGCFHVVLQCCDTIYGGNGERGS